MPEWGESTGRGWCLSAADITDLIQMVCSRKDVWKGADGEPSGESGRHRALHAPPAPAAA